MGYKKIRRTRATSTIDKDMPIEQVQKLLGHEKIDTTLRYEQVKQSNVKIAHKKYRWIGVNEMEDTPIVVKAHDIHLDKEYS